MGVGEGVRRGRGEEEEREGCEARRDARKDYSTRGVRRKDYTKRACKLVLHLPTPCASLGSCNL